MEAVEIVDSTPAWKLAEVAGGEAMDCVEVNGSCWILPDGNGS